jgi:hypothetical protein
MFASGLAAGWVLGTRAGRERYEQLTDAVRQFKENPTVKEATGRVQAQAKGLYAEGKSAVADKLHELRGPKGDEARMSPSSPAQPVWTAEQAVDAAWRYGRSAP